MGWQVKKIDDDLLPIIKRFNEKKVQKTIENFFTYETTSSFSKQSNRMKRAINLFRNKSDVNANTSKKIDEINLSEDESESENDEITSSATKLSHDSTKKLSQVLDVPRKNNQLKIKTMKL